jgi:hypothetical protein
MIIYKFPEKNFSASEGYANIQVVNGDLKLKAKPDEATLALIKKFGGTEVKQKKATSKRKVVK